MLDPISVAQVVEVAGCRTHHHRQLPDGGDDRVLRFSALDERHLKLYGRGVGEVPQARLTREELGLRSVRFTDEGFLHLYPSQFNPYSLFSLATGLDVGLDDSLFIDDFLKVVQEEIVIRV